jgi:hypothetical protein
MNIKVVALLFSVLLTGCVGQPYGASSYESTKCRVTAKNQFNDATIDRHIAIKFAVDSDDVNKANQKYSKKTASIEKRYQTCLVSKERKAYEKQIRRQYSYSY